MRLIMLGFSLLLSACTTAGDYNRSLLDWRGQDVQQVISQLGNPDQVKKQANGNTVYTFITEGYAPQKRPQPPAVGVNFSGSGIPVMVVPNADSLNNVAPVATLCTVTVTTDQHNKIVTANTLGDGCGNGMNLTKRGAI